MNLENRMKKGDDSIRGKPGQPEFSLVFQDVLTHAVLSYVHGTALPEFPEFFLLATLVLPNAICKDRQERPHSGQAVVRLYLDVVNSDEHGRAQTVVGVASFTS